MSDSAEKVVTEAEATPEERMAWLRARGVTIEDPNGYKPVPRPGAPTFQYVRIPVNDGEDCEVRSGPMDVGDSLPALLGPVFGTQGSVSDEALLAHAATAAQAVDISVLRSVMAKGGAESFRLAVPTDGNGRLEVTAYLDEGAMLKGLPKNGRATALALRCGFPSSCEFCGDIYVGRRQWQEGGLVGNVDFVLSDLQTDALWIRRAETENLQEQASTRPEDHADAQAGGGDKRASGEGDGYKWRDDGEEVEVVLAVEKGTGKKDVKVEFRRQELRVLKPVALTIKLLKPVEVDGCNWSIGDGQVVITLEKSTAEPWSKLVA